MRIAFVVTEFPSRSQTFVRDQVTGLLERGHSVDIFAAHSGAANSPATSVGAILYPASRRRTWQWTLMHSRRAGGALRARTWGGTSIASALRFAAAQRGSSRYDIIHCHFGPNGLIGGALRAAGFVTGALVVTFHGYDLSVQLARSGRRAYDVLYKDAELLLPVTQRWCDLLIDLGCEPDRARVHRMGVDTTEIRPPDSRAPGPPIELLTVARLVEKKGLEYAIRAVAQLPRALPVRYTIAGDGPLRVQLEQLVRTLGVSDRVHLVGWSHRAAVRQALEKSHIALVPSVRAADGDEEGLPVFLMEGMAAGLAVVATHHSGIPELVREGRDGLLVPERDEVKLSAAIERLGTSPDLRSRLGASARERVVQLHDQDQLNDQLVAHYHDAIRRASHDRGAA